MLRFVAVGAALIGLIAGGFHWGYKTAESKWIVAYNEASDAYVRNTRETLERAEEKLREYKNLAQARQPKIQEARNEVANTDTAAMFSADELRSLEALRSAYSSDPGRVPD